MIKTKVAVIGGGPIGLFSSLLLQHFNIDHITFEKYDQPRSHPSAHWVSSRSKLILSQVPNLTQKIDQNQQPFEYFRHYRYCQTLLGFQFGFKDHFQSNITKKLQSSKSLFGQYPNHISQAKLLKIMFDTLHQKDRIIFNQSISSIQQSGNKNILYNQNKQKICQADYILLANGVRSTLRDNLGINMTGQSQLFNIINIHFESKKLAEKIKKNNLPAMLHFIWNKQLPSILVNHSYETGTFVLQIPNYQPFLDLTKVYTPRELISTILQKEDWQNVEGDMNVIHVGKWKLQALIAQRLRHKNIFLVGDTAHTYTPAGGFGMNSGFQDAHQIIHFLHFIERNQQCNKQNLFNIYDRQRKQTDMKYLKKSLQNYKITQQISEKLGYPSNLTQAYIKFSHSFPQSIINILPKSKDQLVEQLRLKFMSFMYKRAKFSPQLQLFFDEFDLKSSNLSSKAIQISKRTNRNQIKDLYIDQSITMNQIEQIFGKVNQDNIQIMKPLQGDRQKIIRRDGIFM